MEFALVPACNFHVPALLKCFLHIECLFFCRTLDKRKKLKIALAAAFGMEYLHTKNIVHFDLKCENLLVNLGDPQRPVCKVNLHIKLVPSHMDMCAFIYVSM